MTARSLPREIDLFAEAADWCAALVARVGDAQWSGPGLGGWDLRALVGHTSRALLMVETALGRATDGAAAGDPELRDAVEYVLAAAASTTGMPATTEQAVLERGVQAGLDLGPHPADGFAAVVARVTALVRGAGDATVVSVAGTIRLSDYLPTRTFELVVHGLDIVRAAELPDAPPPAPLAEALRLATELARRRGDGAQVLLALTGRAPLDPGFSVLG